MRTAEIELLGEKYTLCFSAGVMIACDEKYGSVDAALQKIGEGSFEAVFWLLYQMLKAGANYARLNEWENPEVKSYDYYTSLIGLDELAEMKRGITEAVQNGQERSFEVEATGKARNKKKQTRSPKEQTDVSIS